MGAEPFQKTPITTFTTKSVQSICTEISERGYSIIEDFLDKETIDDSQKLISSLNQGPRERIVNIKNNLFHAISYNNYILDIANSFFKEEAKPIQSLLFKYPTQQLIHH